MDGPERGIVLSNLSFDPASNQQVSFTAWVCDLVIVYWTILTTTVSLVLLSARCALFEITLVRMAILV